MKKNWILSIFMVIVLSGCSMFSKTSSALYSGDYAASLPFKDSDTRVKHASLISDLDCRVQIESGLMDLSKSYFDPANVTFKTHTFLDYDELDATDGSRGLLGTLRDDNPIGLNPSKDEEFDTGNGISTGPVVLVDIYELDWYSNENLKGISISFVLNGSLYLDSGSEVEIEKEQLNNYFDVTSNKLVSYMRERFNEITANVPILVCGFVLDDDSQSYGGYTRLGFFNRGQGSFDSVSEEWVMIPSSQMNNLDTTMASEFDSYKNSLTNILTDYTFVSAKAKYEDKEPKKILITIEAHAKSTGEILAIGQVAKENMLMFSRMGCRYTVTIKNNNETYIIIQRKENETDCTVISTL